VFVLVLKEFVVVSGSLFDCGFGCGFAVFIYVHRHDWFCLEARDVVLYDDDFLF